MKLIVDEIFDWISSHCIGEFWGFLAGKDDKYHRMGLENHKEEIVSDLQPDYEENVFWGCGHMRDATKTRHQTLAFSKKS
jgi:hypothetical protein